MLTQTTLIVFAVIFSISLLVGGLYKTRKHFGESFYDVAKVHGKEFKKSYITFLPGANSTMIPMTNPAQYLIDFSYKRDLHQIDHEPRYKKFEVGDKIKVIISPYYRDNLFGNGKSEGYDIAFLERIKA